MGIQSNSVTLAARKMRTEIVVYVNSRTTPQPVITISPALAKNQVGLGLQGTF